jgi:hypothetical protein
MLKETAEAVSLGCALNTALKRGVNERLDELVVATIKGAAVTQSNRRRC